MSLSIELPHNKVTGFPHGELSKRDVAKMQARVFLKPNLSNDIHNFCYILFFGSELLNPAHTHTHTDTRNYTGCELGCRSLGVAWGCHSDTSYHVS